MCSPITLLLASACLAAASSSATALDKTSPIWPPPQHMQLVAGSRLLHKNFDIVVSPSSVTSTLLVSTTQRYYEMVLRASRGSSTLSAATHLPAIERVEVTIAKRDEHLDETTDYSYTFKVDSNSSLVRVSATTVFGAMYALESFSQLVGANGLEASAVTVSDAPDYAWRGLMLDSGRRFIPLDTVKNLMDTMAANKLNVLHLHASDHCRFGVESKKFPALTGNLTGIHAGFYTQEDIKDMISYAATRGIRVIPEFDIPGHSRGFLPLENAGIKFCTDEPTRSQLYNDPEGSTYGVLTELFAEMSQLFTDKVFNIGCDETAVKGPCSLKSTAALETKLFNDITTKYGKTPAGWEEAFFDAGAATMNTIVDAWSRHNPGEITATGRQAVESASDHFYFTAPGPAGAAGWAKCWYDIATGVNASHKSLLLGGEMSMWTDEYCYIDQCGSSTGHAPPGAALFDPAKDAEFAQSIGGMIWPRGFVGAAAFWHYDAATDPTSAAFVKSIDDLNSKLIARGSYSCPNSCACDTLSACGKPYIKAQ